MSDDFQIVSPTAVTPIAPIRPAEPIHRCRLELRLERPADRFCDCVCESLSDCPLMIVLSDFSFLTDPALHPFIIHSVTVQHMTVQALTVKYLTIKSKKRPTSAGRENGRAHDAPASRTKRDRKSVVEGKRE